MMDKYLPVFLSIEDTINPDQISNSICRNAAPNLQGTSTMLHCYLQTLIIVPLSSPLANKLPSATAKYFTFLPISPEHLLPFFCTPVPMFLCIVESLGLLFMWEVWLLAVTLPRRPLLTRLLWIVDGCTWVLLVSASSELIALLDIL